MTKSDRQICPEISADRILRLRRVGGHVGRHFGIGRHEGRREQGRDVGKAAAINADLSGTILSPTNRLV